MYDQVPIEVERSEPRSVSLDETEGVRVTIESMDGSDERTVVKTKEMISNKRRNLPI